MGWTYYNAEHYKNGKIDRKAELDEKFTWSENGRTVTVVKSAMRGSIYYAAVRSQNETNGTDETFAVVCLTHTDSKSYWNFGYKDMDETMGPGEHDCPKGILDLLTPTDSEWANEWRRLCREKIERNRTKKPLPIGTRIEFTRNGKTYTCVKREANHQFRTPWWYVPAENKYYPKKYIPEDYRIIE